MQRIDVDAEHHPFVGAVSCRFERWPSSLCAYYLDRDVDASTDAIAATTSPQSDFADTFTFSRYAAAFAQESRRAAVMFEEDPLRVRPAPAGKDFHRHEQHRKQRSHARRRIPAS
jgi:hypothetical protein